MSIPPQAGSRVRQTLGTFRMEHSVSAHIRAPVQRVWSLLTNAADFPRWNSTVSGIRGEIAEGGKIELTIPSSKRSFALSISQVEPNKRMVWSSGVAPMFKGVRTFTLVPLSDGSSDFSMVEVLSGLMLPLIKPSLPDFDAMFQRYALDLQQESERAPR
jgi:uncharacterized protein YndB with AHSA1/START domain